MSSDLRTDNGSGDDGVRRGETSRNDERRDKVERWKEGEYNG